jgi:hypothetical protein
MFPRPSPAIFSSLKNMYEYVPVATTHGASPKLWLASMAINCLVPIKGKTDTGFRSAVERRGEIEGGSEAGAALLLVEGEVHVNTL